MPTLAKSPRKEQASDQALIIDTCHTLHHDQYPSWSRDQLLCNPREAAELCAQVRRRLHRPGLSDYQILWPYLNAHKRGLFNTQRPPPPPPPRGRGSSPRRPRKT